MVADVVRGVDDTDWRECSTVVLHDAGVGHDIRADIGIATWDTLRPILEFSGATFERL